MMNCFKPMTPKQMIEARKRIKEEVKKTKEAIKKNLWKRNVN